MSRQRVPPGPPAAPPVQRLRLQYAKRGRMRFSSTRDFQRALERAVRRSGLPVAFSSGFHPHPRISYANAAPTGTASEAEYVEIALVERVDPQAVRDALDTALPHGLDVIRVVEAGPGSLADPLEASVWRVEFRATDGDGPEAGEPLERLRAARAEFLGLDAAEVTRTVKGKPRTFDTRGALVRLDVTGPAAPEPDSAGAPTAPDGASTRPGATCAILHMVVRHTTPAVRPDDILTALRTYAGLDLVATPLVTRLAQGRLTADATVVDPLAAPE